MTTALATDQLLATTATPYLLAASGPAVLMSFYKPLIFLAMAVLWAKVAGFFDKDAMRFYEQRRLWNGLQMAGGFLAFFLWLMIPYFWLGLLLALMVLAGSLGGYIMYRNGQVEHPSQRWRLSVDTFRHRLQEREHQRVQAGATLKFLDKRGDILPVPSGDNPNAHAHYALEQLMEFAMPRGAQRIEVVAENEKASLGVWVDGMRYPQPGIEPRQAFTLIEYLKENAGLDIEQRRRKQVSIVPIKLHDQTKHELTVTCFGSTRSLNLTLDIDKQKASVMAVVQMGLIDVQRKQLTTLLGDSKNVVLVACPGKQGMTTTLSSLLNLHDPYVQSIISLENGVEVELEGVSHVAIKRGSDALAIEKQITTLLRSDPKVFMLSQLADASHARLIARAAKDIRFYVGLKSSDTFDALKVWVKAVGDTKLASGSLGAIISQRLVRQLCSTCKVAYKPDPAVLKKLNLPPDRVSRLYKHSGKIQTGKDRMELCPDCYGMGYRGRTGIFELMLLDDQARVLLAQGQLDQLRSHLRRHKMMYQQDAALVRVVEGATSISEVTRMLGGESA